MRRANKKGSTASTGLGVYRHVPVTAPTEPEHRPPPASRLPSWSVGTVDSELIGGEFVKCPLCGDPERPEDIVGGVCLACSDAITFAHNARRERRIVRG